MVSGEIGHWEWHFYETENRALNRIQKEVQDTGDRIFLRARDIIFGPLGDTYRGPLPEPRIPLAASNMVWRYALQDVDELRAKFDDRVEKLFARQSNAYISRKMKEKT